MPLTSGQTLSFFVLKADFNHDRHVNFDNLVLLAQNYNKTGLSFEQGNSDYDAAGNVNFDDLVPLAQKYNAYLAPLVTLKASEPVLKPATSATRAPVKRSAAADAL